jgi:hypothetical protein
MQTKEIPIDLLVEADWNANRVPPALLGPRSLTGARPPHPQTLKSTPPMTVGTPPETRSTGRSTLDERNGRAPGNLHE